MPPLNFFVLLCYVPMIFTEPATGFKYYIFKIHSRSHYSKVEQQIYCNDFFFSLLRTLPGKQCPGKFYENPRLIG